MKRKFNFIDKDGKPLTEEQQDILSKAIEEEESFKEIEQKIEEDMIANFLYGKPLSFNNKQ